MRKQLPSILTAVILVGAFFAGYLAMRSGTARGGSDAASQAGYASAAVAGVTRGGALRPQEGPVSNPSRSSFVVLTEVMPAHPAWQELTSLTAEVEREQRSLLREQAAEAEIARRAAAGEGTEQAIRSAFSAIARSGRTGRGETAAALKEAYESRWEAELARLRSESDRAIAARRAVLAAQVDERIGVRRGEVKAALAEQIERIRREREARLLSLQLKLALADADPAAAAQAPQMQEELSRVQAEIDRLVKAAQKEADERLAAYAREVEESAGQELRAYAAELESEAARQAELARRALEQELAERLEALEEPSSPGDAAELAGGLKAGRPTGGSAAPGSPTPLQLRRNALQAKVIADIRRVAEAVASRNGLKAPQLVGTAAERPAGAVDLTAEVSGALARQTKR